MTLDSSGNLLLGKSSANGTSASSANDGLEIRPTSLSFQADTIAAYFNTRTDGTILSLQKDGQSMGGIGVADGDNLYIASTVSGHAGFKFSDTTVTPWVNNTNSDNAMDIGASANRFKDLYLSGGVYLGGTVAANKLDDYEEGTHDITLNQGGVGINSSYVTWRYTKIGRMVYIEGLFLASSSGDTNTVKINLPFTYLAKSGNTADQIVQTVGTYQVPTGSGGIKGTITAGTSKLEFKKTVDNGVWTALIGTDIASGDHIYVNLAYPTS